MKILGIETSCDETAAAVVENGRKLLSNVVSSSVDLHSAYGGVVPEIAARSHLEVILPGIDQALQDAIAKSHKPKATSKKRVKDLGLKAHGSRLFDPWDQIDAIAVTQGPGLLGSLLIGVLTARTLAIAQNKPLYAINHVEAHVYASFLDSKPNFPLLALIVSGGHTQLVLFEAHNRYKMLGQTLDDAVGEAYDKVAKILGFPYPGGPSIAEAAAKGNPRAFHLPAAKMQNPHDFSFSGLKTAVLRAAQTASGHDFTFPSTKLPKVLSGSQKADLAASFQRAANQTLVAVLQKAITESQPASVVMAGGVAANKNLREMAQTSLSTEVIYPDFALCTDNAAMIAAAAFYKGKKARANPYSLAPDPSLSM